ncbi:MAG: hypothetical protein WAN11_14345 [Syntrophobacteraceae bacterium]
MLDIHRKPEEILKGRQTLSPKGYGEWFAAVHNRPPDEVEYDPDSDIMWAPGQNPCTESRGISMLRMMS